MFKHPSQALKFFNSKNPARPIYRNILENSTGTTNIAPDFSGRSPRDIWASVQAGIDVALQWYNRRQCLAWTLRNIGPRDRQLHVDEIADIVQASPKTIYRWLDDIDADFERELKRRQLLVEE